MPRSRPWTDLDLASVERAVAEQGRWIEVPRRFRTEANASVTGRCLEGGYLRVKARDGDEHVVVDGRRLLRTAAPVTARVEPDDDVWRLSIRFDG
jgi:hypothetical protein